MSTPVFSNIGLNVYNGTSWSSVISYAGVEYSNGFLSVTIPKGSDGKKVRVSWYFTSSSSSLMYFLAPNYNSSPNRDASSMFTLISDRTSDANEDSKVPINNSNGIPVNSNSYFVIEVNQLTEENNTTTVNFLSPIPTGVLPLPPYQINYTTPSGGFVDITNIDIFETNTQNTVTVIIPNTVVVGGTEYTVRKLLKGAINNNYNLVNYIVDCSNCNGLTEIGNSAFNNGTIGGGDAYLKNFIFPPLSLKTIGQRAFLACSSLLGVGTGTTLGTDLIIPNSVTSLGEFAFSGCTSINGSLTLSNNLTTISKAAFNNCANLTGSITIPNSVTTIEWDAFANPNNFDGTLTLSNQLTSIGNNAFNGCRFLQNNLVIPNTVESIGSNAFTNCINFKSIVFTPTSSLKTIGSYAFAYVSNLTNQTIVIPNSVTAIGDSAFTACNMTSVTLPTNNIFLSIGASTFKDCTNLISINIPETITVIAEAAFKNTNLSALIIPASVNFIDASAFDDISSLESITMLSYDPPTILTPGNTIFQNTSVTSIQLAVGASASWGSSFSGILLNKPSVTEPLSAFTYYTSPKAPEPTSWTARTLAQVNEDIAPGTLSYNTSSGQLAFSGNFAQKVRIISTINAFAEDAFPEFDYVILNGSFQVVSGTVNVGQLSTYNGSLSNTTVLTVPYYATYNNFVAQHVYGSFFCIEITGTEGQFQFNNIIPGYEAPGAPAAHACFLSLNKLLLSNNEMKAINQIKTGDKIQGASGKERMVKHCGSISLTKDLPDYNKPRIIPVDYFDKNIPNEPIIISGLHAIYSPIGKLLTAQLKDLDVIQSLEEISLRTNDDPKYYHIVLDDESDAVMCHNLPVESTSQLCWDAVHFTDNQ